MIEEFAEIYKSRPVKDNSGGMGFNHSYGLWKILRDRQPNVVMESGVHKGHSTWVIEQAVPEAQVFCFDISLANRHYLSTRAHYVESDFREFDWSQVDLTNSIAFFDDHFNNLERAKDAYWFGFQGAIFEDNYPIGEGDSYSIQHLLAGAGFTNLQQSKKYRGGPLARIKRAGKQIFLESMRLNQSVLVTPNLVDRANFLARVEEVNVFPPVWLPTQSHFGKPWNVIPHLEPFLNEPLDYSWDWSYSFLTEIVFRPGNYRSTKH